MKDSNKFIEAIQTHVGRLDLKKQIPNKKPDIPEDEVTLQAYKSTNIT